MTPKNIFIAGLKGKEAPRQAVGSATSIVTADLMDKIGIHFPDAHLDAEKMACLAAAGHTILGFDNVMPLFSVWHESAALGCNVDWGDNFHMPACHDPILGKIEDEIRIPADLLKKSYCAVPLKALSLLKRRYGDDLAVVGKAFGPWTLGYHVFGVENFLIATALNPDAVRKAMRKLLDVTISFANAQVEAGADAITLADHCTRDLCSPENYAGFLMEIHQELHERIRCPLILHICGDTSDRIHFINQTGIECFHFDSKVPAVRARALAGEKMSLMGGTSNIKVVLFGTQESIQMDVSEKISAGIDIIGPECAVPLDAPYKNLKLIADEVKNQKNIR